MCSTCPKPVAIGKALLGVDRPPPEILDARVAACNACPKKRTVAGIDTCGYMVIGNMIDPETCGCVLALKRRVRGEVCPFGRWPGETPVEYDMEV